MLCLFASLLSFASVGQSDTSLACNYTLSGKVLDGETKEPLPGATVFLHGANKRVLTNNAGDYEIKSVCPGQYTLECQAFGYKSVVSSIALLKNTVRNFVLHTDTCMLESVIIIIEEKEVENIRPVVELRGEDLDRTRGLSLGEALKSLPGVSALQSGPTVFKPVIHGMYGNRVLILNNGVRQEGQQWGSEHAPEIDPFVASKLTVVKGAASVQYGADAIGGVILVDPEDLRKTPGIGGELNLIGFSNNRQGVVSGRLDYKVNKIKGLSLRTQGTFRQAGNSRTSDYYMKNTGFKETGFSWAAGYNRERFNSELYYSLFNSVIGIFSASHFGNLTDLQAAINSKVPLETSGFSYEIDAPFQEISHELFKARTQYRFYSIGKLDLTLARQFNYRAEFDKHGSSHDHHKPEVEFKITTHTANLVLDHNSIGKMKGLAGISFIRQANTADGTLRPFIPNFISYSGGIFIIERWKAKRLEVETGIRYDYKWMKVYRFEKNTLETPEFSFSNFSGVLGGIYDVNQNWKLRLNFATAFRPVAVNELFSEGVHHGSSRLEYGDRNLRSEYAYNASLALNYQYKKLYGEINLYNNYISNYIYLAPGLVFDSASQTFVPEYALTIRGAFPVFRYRQIDALFSGMDFTLNDSIGRNFIFSSRLSLLRAYNIREKEYIILTPPANFEYGVKYHFNISGKVKQSYLRIAHLLIARKENVPLNQDVAPPPSGYSLVSFEAGCRLYAGKQAFDFTFSIYNVLNTRYRDYMDRFRYFADGAGRNCVLRIKIPFDFQPKKNNDL
jgi:iron complex outermembrane receptor protein